MRTPFELITAHYAASARQDIAAMMADMAPDVQWTEMAGFPCAGTWVGPQQVIDRVFKVLGADWIGYRFDLETLIDGGDRIVGVGSYSGTHGRTGKAMQVRAAHVWEVQGERIVRFEQFTDTLLVDRAMA